MHVPLLPQPEHSLNKAGMSEPTRALPGIGDAFLVVKTSVSEGESPGPGPLLADLGRMPLGAWEKGLKVLWVLLTKGGQIGNLWVLSDLLTPGSFRGPLTGLLQSSLSLPISVWHGDLPPPLSSTLIGSVLDVCASACKYMYVGVRQGSISHRQAGRRD